MEVPMTKVSWKRQTKGQMKNINDITYFELEKWNGAATFLFVLICFIFVFLGVTWLPTSI